ncbi:tyrosine-type recombinase/integrase [Limnoglobus roseus]|uniref:Site-specific integrase n=1 Tax=Limnoglobus roseus TaxID=2598579 RepID=A0A5C1AIL0_9BACT|nr:tyrosine-type recombinase/integrase [Limnoglobus roseus]QEL19269.1 site-specific integrase [Limnoglobus roseus]
MASLTRAIKTYYVDHNGRRCPKDAVGAKKVTEASKKWYGRSIPSLPPKKKVPLSADRQVAERMLARMVANAERGMLDLHAVGDERVPLLDHLKQFADHMSLGLACKIRGKAKRPAPPQVALCVQRIRHVLVACRFENAMSLNADAPAALARWLQTRRAITKAEGGLSAQTADFYRKAARRFAWWLSVRKHLPVRPDLFDDVPGFDPRNNRVHLRRPCSTSELARLLLVTRQDPGDYRGMFGEDRFFVYLLAFATGFRASELAVLTRANFAIDADPPVIRLRGDQTKNGRPARQPLPLGVVTEFRPYLECKPADGPLWPGTWCEKPVRMLKRDLDGAGVVYREETEDGPRFLDFHALRHSFVSALAAAGVGVKELQTLARHSDPALTLAVYTHSTNAKLAESVQKLPLPIGGMGAVNPWDTMTREELQAALACSLALNAVLMGGARKPGEAGTSPV